MGPTNKANTELTILYCNTNRSKDSHDIMNKQSKEILADVICVSEPNWTTVSNCDWIRDKNTDAAIKSNGTMAVKKEVGDGFCSIELDNLIIYSCYISPNANIQTFECFLMGIKASIGEKKKPVIVIGDFNAKSKVWGSQINDRRGNVVLDWAADTDLFLLNDGKTPTFRRGLQTSFIDLTWASMSMLNRIKEWRVLDELESLSDHNYIMIRIDLVKPPGTPLQRTRQFRRIRPNDIKRIGDILQGYKGQLQSPEDMTEVSKWTCNKVLRAHPNRKPPVHWWNTEIADLRRTTVAAKRAKCRINGSNWATLSQKADATKEYHTARSKLRHAIREAKTQSYYELLDDLSQNPWGKGYKLLCKGRPPRSMLQEEKALEIAKELFPIHPTIEWSFNTVV